jgi:hypothetical protein
LWEFLAVAPIFAPSGWPKFVFGDVRIASAVRRKCRGHLTAQANDEAHKAASGRRTVKLQFGPEVVRFGYCLIEGFFGNSIRPQKSGHG